MEDPTLTTLTVAEKVAVHDRQFCYTKLLPKEELPILLRYFNIPAKFSLDSVLQCFRSKIYTQCKNGLIGEYSESYLVPTARLLGIIIAHDVFFSYASIILFLDIILNMFAINPRKNGSNLFLFAKETVLYFKDRLPPPDSCNSFWVLFLENLLFISHFSIETSTLAFELAKTHQKALCVDSTIPSAKGEMSRTLVHEKSDEQEKTRKHLHNNKFFLFANGVAQNFDSLGTSLLSLDHNSTSTVEKAFLKDCPQPTGYIFELINMLINDLNMDNMNNKIPKILHRIKPDYYVWFAHYSVIRVTQETHLQQLYVVMFDKIADAKLMGHLLNSTYHYIKILLATDEIKTMAGERNLLKNMANWLVRLTLSRNKPILFKQLDIKNCIYEAYEQGKMIAVIPFVHKVLMGCKNNKVFQPPNPWLMAILKPLVEIHHQEQLKLHIKFEIELCLKHFHMSPTALKPDGSFNCRTRLMKGNCDFISENPSEYNHTRGRKARASAA
jgi:CCR4-NOT transcription complex subunit 1